MPFFKPSSGKKSSSAASEQFRSKMAAKLGVAADQNFQKKLEERVQKDIDNYKKVKINSAKARGEHIEDIEISKNTKTMLTILANQKMQKEMKKEKAALAALEREKKAKKNAELLVKKNLQTQNELKIKTELEYQQQQLEYQQQNSKSYFFGHSDD